MVNEGLAYNTRNLDLKELKVMLLHKLDENDKAVKTAEELLDLDPINYLAMHVRDDITGSEQLDEVHNQMAYPVQEYIDMAVPYLEAGLYKESTDLLSKLDESSDILINYYRAYSHLKSGEAAKAETFFEQAHNSSIDYAFPFRNMSRTVLEAAVQEHPNDEKVHYLLGNLLYDDKPAEAIAYWEQASSIRPDFAMNIRNRAFGAFYHENDPAKAVDYMQQAISLNPDIALWYTELSEYYEKLEPSYDKQLDLLEDHEEVVLDGTDSKKKLVRLYTLDGQYDKAIDILKNYHFRIWEGGRFNYWKYVDALVLRAQKYINNGEYELAVDDLNDALKYPENLEVGEPLHDERDAQIYFTMAQAYEGMGKKAKAQDLYQKIVGTEHPDGWQDMLYYQGQAFSAMGDRAKARASYFELLEYGQKQLDKKYIKGFFPFYGKSAIPEYQLRSKAHYYIGLARLGLNDYQAADEALQKALEIWPNNLWAQQALTEVQQEL
jgi:tetratricopeptide (TPR) repeat protein